MRKPQTREGQLSELPGTLSEKWPSFRDLLPRVREPQAATYSIQAKVKLGPTRSWTQRSVGTSACFAADLFISQGSEFCRLVISQAVAQPIFLNSRGRRPGKRLQMDIVLKRSVPQERCFSSDLKAFRGS